MYSDVFSSKDEEIQLLAIRRLVKTHTDHMDTLMKTIKGKKKNIGK